MWIYHVQSSSLLFIGLLGSWTCRVCRCEGFSFGITTVLRSVTFFSWSLPLSSLLLAFRTRRRSCISLNCSAKPGSGRSSAISSAVSRKVRLWFSFSRSWSVTLSVGFYELAIGLQIYPPPSSAKLLTWKISTTISHEKTLGTENAVPRISSV